MEEELLEKCLKNGILDLFTDIMKAKRVVSEEATQQLMQLIGVMRQFVSHAGRRDKIHIV